MQWPPKWTYDFVNVIVVNPRTKKIFLTRSYDTKQHTPFGGELKQGEQERIGVCRKVYSETGGFLDPNPGDLIHIENMRVYPEKIGYIKMIIVTFLYVMKDTDREPDIEHQQYEGDCKIEEIIKISIPELYQKIKLGEVILYSNLVEILPKIEVAINGLKGQK